MGRTRELSSVGSINSSSSCSISGGPPLPLDDAEYDTGRATSRGGGNSSEDDRQSLVYSSAAPESDGAATTQSGRASQARGSNKRSNGRVNVSKSQRPLREVVARRAFECVVGAHGDLSKVLRSVAESGAAPRQTLGRHDQDELEQAEPETRSSSSERSGQQHDGHGRHSRVDSPGLGCRAEPVLHGEDIDVDHQVLTWQPRRPCIVSRPGGVVSVSTELYIVCTVVVAVAETLSFVRKRVET